MGHKLDIKLDGLDSGGRETSFVINAVKHTGAGKGP